MKMRLVMLVAAILAVVITRPVAAADMSCAQWLAYRTGETSMQGLGLVLTTFMQGYIDGVNEFGDQFNGYLVSEVSPGKFAPTPPTRPLNLENTVAVLDRQCTANREQSAHVAAANEIQSEMFRRATPIMESMRTILHNLNDAKGYK
jgi:hypothetical protein